MPRKKQQEREQGIHEVGEGLRTSSREQGVGSERQGLDRVVREGERGTQSDESFIGRETERAAGAPRQEPRRPGNLDRGRTASPRRGQDRSSSGEKGVSQRLSRGEHQTEESGVEEETSL